VRTVQLRDGRSIARVGMGTWRFGERRERRDAEVAALRLGLDLGLTLIDTAEMYASGGAEEVVARAIEGRRDQAFLVTKVLPQNASRAGTLRACERSLKRLKSDRIDLYLLHWEGGHPLEETVAAFVELQGAGKIAAWGVSNFDEALLLRTLGLAGGAGCAADQVLYNLARRGIEWRLLDECARRKIVVMAYSPLDEGRLETGEGTATKKRRALASVAQRRGATPAQVALAFTIARDFVVTIPKAGDPGHVRENAAAGDLVLDAADLSELDAAFPPPKGAAPLEMI
jgi:diketogulonate reductase-like aldo/keto reductase